MAGVLELAGGDDEGRAGGSETDKEHGGIIGGGGPAARNQSIPRLPRHKGCLVHFVYRSGQEDDGKESRAAGKKMDYNGSERVGRWEREKRGGGRE